MAKRKSNDPIERPPFAYMGCYNIADADLMYEDGELVMTQEELDASDIEVWREREDLPELSLDEFYAVWQMTVDVLSQFLQAQDLLTRVPYDFYVWEDKFCDRTQKVELVTSNRLPFLINAIPALQLAMQEFPLWRVWFFGEGDAEKVEQTRFVVYPDAVRFSPCIEMNSLSNAVLENVRLRAGIVE